jgi:DNA adenine methylase
MLGGANSFQQVENPRLGADINPYLIACLTAARDGWIPPHTVTEAEYQAIKANMSAYPPELVGFVGFGCSFGAKWWGGYARDNVGCRHHATEAADALRAQAPYLRGASLVCCSYDALDIPDGAIAYLDPPYANTTEYKHSGAFDHTAFWSWACDLSARCRVFVSEYTAPDGWVCIWQRDQTTNIDNKQSRGFKAQERLFVPESQLRRLL